MLVPRRRGYYGLIRAALLVSCDLVLLKFPEQTWYTIKNLGRFLRSGIVTLKQ